MLSAKDAGPGLIVIFWKLGAVLFCRVRQPGDMSDGQWSVSGGGGGARTRDNETFPTLNQSMICTYQVNGPPQFQKWSVLPTPSPNREAVNEWCERMWEDISLSQFLSFITCLVSSLRVAAMQQPASPSSQTVSCYPSAQPAPLLSSPPLTLTPLPHAPSAPLMQRCTLDNVKCIGLYLILEKQTLNMLSDQCYFEITVSNF